MSKKQQKIRKFGQSTRSSDEGKIDYNHLSAISDRCFVEYMHQHRIQEDGELRDADNYKYDMPISSNRKSLMGHYNDLKMMLEGWTVMEDGKALNPFETIQAIKFNLSTFDHNLMKGFVFDRKYTAGKIEAEYNKRFYRLYQPNRFKE